MIIYRNTFKTFLFLFSLFLSRSVFADCPLNSKEPRFNCLSYELGAPLNINNIIGGASLTVIGGSVGIGIPSPVATLDVQSSGTNISESQLILRNPNTSDNSAVTVNTYSASEWRGSTYFIKDGSGQGTIYGVSTANASGTPTERFRINSNGDIGIGTSTPGSALEVAGAIRTDSICDRTGNNCKMVASGWGSGGGGSGTVTSVGVGIGLLGGPITTSGTISVDVGTTANKIVQLDGSGALPAVSATNLTNVNASRISGKNISAPSPAIGQILSFDGINWINKSVAITDIAGLSSQLTNKLDASNMPANCGPNQTLSFSSPLGAWSCSDIVITSASLGQQSANMVLASPDGAGGNPTFRKLATTDLPSSVADSLWINSGSSIYRPTGNVGIGVANRTAKLAVAGEIESTGGGYRFPDGSLQTTAANSPSTPPIAQIYAGVSTQIPSNTWTKVPLTFTEFRFNINFDQTNSRLTPTKAGYYRYHFVVRMSTNGTGGSTMMIALYLNGVRHRETHELVNYNANFGQTLQSSGIIYLDGVSDYVEGYALHGAQPATITSGSGFTSLTLEFIR